MRKLPVCSQKKTCPICFLTHLQMRTVSLPNPRPHYTLTCLTMLWMSLSMVKAM